MVVRKEREREREKSKDKMEIQTQRMRWLPWLLRDQRAVFTHEHLQATVTLFYLCEHSEREELCWETQTPVTASR